MNKLTLFITLLTCFVVSSVLHGCTKESTIPADTAKDKPGETFTVDFKFFF